ncbi:MAG: hypothetical protein JSR80_00595 [Verrucomicrobia bacterium]|nr:hypothetical protein [Verrucomicrobiota bacterium]
MKTVATQNVNSNTVLATTTLGLGVCGIIASLVLGSKYKFTDLIKGGLAGSVVLAGLGAIWLRADVVQIQKLKDSISKGNLGTAEYFNHASGHVNSTGKTVIFYCNEDRSAGYKKDITEVDVTVLTGLYFGKRGKVSELPNEYQALVPKCWSEPIKGQERGNPQEEVKEEVTPPQTTKIKGSGNHLADDWSLVDGTVENEDD